MWEVRVTKQQKGIFIQSQDSEMCPNVAVSPTAVNAICLIFFYYLTRICYVFVCAS